MTVTTLRDRRALLLAIERLRHGPSEFTEPRPFDPPPSQPGGLPQDAHAIEATRRHLKGAYHAWIDAWVIPQIEAVLQSNPRRHQGMK